MSNSSLVSYTKLSPNHSGKRTQKIYMIVPHCVVGQCSVETLGAIFAPTSRQASCNYGIGSDGRVALIVDEGNRSWCTSSNWVDQRGVTIECASDATAPYAFNTTVYNKLVDLCVDICKRNGKKKLLWLGTKAKTDAYTPASDEMVLYVHRWTANKSCPGDWMFARMGDLATKVTKKLAGGNNTEKDTDHASKVTYPTVPFSVTVKVSDLNIRESASTSAKSHGYTGKGEFTIVKVKDNWGLLKSYQKNANGWIYLANSDYVKIGATIKQNNIVKVADAKSKSSKLSGAYKTTASGGLKLRNAPVNGTVIYTMPKGTVVSNYGYYTKVEKVNWLLVALTVGGKTITGYCSAKYLKKL